MDFSTMKTMVSTYSGEKDLTRCGYAINDIYRSIVNKFKWPNFLVTCTTPITLVAGTQQYALASDFRWVNRFWYYDKSGTPIYLRQTKVIPNNTNDGYVEFFRIKRSKSALATTKSTYVVELDTIPNSSFVSNFVNLYYDYYYQPTDLSGATDVPQVDLGDEQLIVWGAVVLLTAKQDDQGGFGMFAQMYTDGMADMTQRAIELYGHGIVVGPGDEITEIQATRIHDYGKVL